MHTDGARLKVENVTVWRQREDMFTFFRSDLHKAAMALFDGRLTFRVRRIWVKGSDLPNARDSDAVDNFWTRIKSDKFEDAKSAASKKAVSYSDTDELFDSDIYAPQTTFGYQQVIPKSQLDEDEKYFSVQIWGIGPLDVAARFNKQF